MKRAALNTFLRSNRGRGYRYGEWDCALFSFDGVLAQTGIDHLYDYRGRYDSYESGVELMKQIDGVATLRMLATKKLGEPKPVAFAKTGDVVSHGPSLGILYSGYGLFLGDAGEIERLPLSQLDQAWSV